MLVIGQERHCAFDVFDALVGFGDGETISVPFRGPSTDILELSNILQRETGFRSAPTQLTESSPDELVLGIVLSEDSQKNIGVDQILRRGDHQSWSA
jgi:hypothetical protein